MTATSPPDLDSEAPDDDADETPVPVWEDEYLDRVSDRIMFHYDLAKDFEVDDHAFDLYGQLRIERHKQFFHPSITYGHHESFEHLFVSRESTADVDLEAYVDLAHDLAETWVENSEEHYSTDFTFAVVVPELTDSVREFVSGFSDRTLLKYGYHGHYEVHLVAVAPTAEELVASRNADIVDAFTTWEPIERERGLIERLRSRLGV